VERIIDLAKNYEHIVVGRIEKIGSHPKADRLHVAGVNIGKEEVTIVCGGKNLKEGQFVAVALPGAKVKWHGEGNFIELAETEIRGIKSFGMICAAEEIGFEKLAQEKGSIWDLTSLVDVKPGTSLANALELDDQLFDIEVTTNRPDAASIIGQAREGSVVTGEKFLWKIPSFPKPTAPSPQPLLITIHNPDLCPHYQSIIIDKVKVGPSPWWLQKRLLLAGFRPINTIVDITNYVLHEYGQPLHAFDADSLKGGEIHIRYAKEGEKIKALDGKEYTLETSMLVIADAQKPVAIAGIMGGEETATIQSTTRVVIESATFDPVSIRRTSRALNLSSEACGLFEKGLSTESTSFALARAIELIHELAGGEVVSEIYSLRKDAYEPQSFSFNPSKGREQLGVEISDKHMREILEKLGFVIEDKKSFWKITVPYWRDHDIEDSVDFVEEIARVYGYEKIPSLLPQGRLPYQPQDPLLVWQKKTKEIFQGSGFSETYAYSFLSAKQMEQAGISLHQAVHLLNPLSVDQEYLRPSLIPTMLSTIEQNQSYQNSGNLFELSFIYLLQEKDLPKQSLRLLFACYAPDGSFTFFQAKGMLERFARETNFSFELKREESSSLFHTTRSAKIFCHGQVIGTIGQIDPSVAKNFGIDYAVCLCELDFEALVSKFSLLKIYEPLPLYPEIKRDLAFFIDQQIEFGTIQKTLLDLDPLIETVSLIDEYQGSGVPLNKKSVCLHIDLRAKDRTLEANEAQKVIDHIIEVMESVFHGMIRT
jgi:phenylalanyl-tRNA synthetase beta chain